MCFVETFRLVEFMLDWYCNSKQTDNLKALLSFKARCVLIYSLEFSKCLSEYSSDLKILPSDLEDNVFLFFYFMKTNQDVS